MSKLRPSPRRGGRRSKQTPHDTLELSYEENSQGPTKTQAKLKTPPTSKNTTPALKKPGKSPRSKGKKTPPTTGSKGKEVKGKRQSTGKNKTQPGNDSIEYQSEELECESKLVSKKMQENVSLDEGKLQDENDGECEEHLLQNNNDSLDDSVGKELIDCLSKGGRKKKAMRNCSNCGSQSPVSRAKKCPNCGKNLFNKSSGYSREVTCPKCNHHERFNGTLMTVYCSSCDTLLTRKYREKDSPVSPQNGNVEETEEVPDQLPPVDNKETDTAATTTTTMGYYSDTIQDNPSCPVNSDGSFQMGYSSNAPQSDDPTVFNVDADTSQAYSSSTFGNETSQETLRRIIKRKILGEFDQSGSNSLPNKRQRNEVPVEEEMSIDKSSDDDKITIKGQPSSLNIPTSITSQTSAISSPLMEYAQKISARMFLPPEMPPQDVYVRRGGRSRKGHLGRNKRLHKESSSRTQHSPSPMTGTSPDHPSSSQESSFQENRSLPPPLLPSGEDGFTHSTMTLNGKREDYSETPSSCPVIPPLVAATRSFHDPTINSIRRSTPPILLTTTASSNRNSFYSSNHSMAPYMISSSSLSFPSCSATAEEENSNFASHNGQIISKNLYPGYRTSSVPPLLSVRQDGDDIIREDGCSTKSIAHTTVIVDPRNTLKNNKDSSAPPALLSVVDTPSPKQTKGDVGLADGQNHSEGGYNNNFAGDTTPIYKVTHSKRKQKLHLVNASSVGGGGDEIIYETAVVKKKKKKKKKEKEKDRDRSDRGHHSKSKGDKYKSDLERKARRKMKKEKRRDKEMEEFGMTTEDPMGESQDDIDEESSQCTNEAEKECSVLYSIKIKDCIIHQMKWGKYQMTLMVPQPQKQNNKGNETAPSPTTTTAERAVTPSDSVMADVGGTSLAKGRRLRSSQKKRKDEEIPEETDSIVGQVSPLPPVKEPKKSKKRKLPNAKSKVKTEAEINPEPPLPPECADTFSRNDHHGNNIDDGVEGDSVIEQIDPSLYPPSFSIYELRNKVFSDLPPRTVHAFTYKLRIRTRRPALHWIHILKIIGGLPETCHMCRLLDVESLRHLCALHKIDVPDCIDNLIRPDPNMRGRKLIDLSDEDPCSFLLNPEVLHLSLPHSTFQGFRRYRKSLTSDASLLIDEMLSKREHKLRKHYDEEDDEVNNDEAIMNQTEYQENEEDRLHTHKTKKRKYMKRSSKNAQPISPKGSPVSPETYSHKHSAIGTGKKKPCPNCGYSMLRKSKKCVNCGKPFGVFTFGRRQCTYCEHINLARMSVCFKCGQSLDKAPTAVPKISEATLFDGQETEPQEIVPVIKHDFKFGVKKKRRVQSVPSSPPLSSSARQSQQDVITYDSADDVFQDDCDPSSPLPSYDKRKRGDVHHTGYRYGKIPWNDADLALIITSNGIPKLCLQEVCNKVLRYHLKSDVFELVKSLNLQLEPGDSNLLKKLQALGLHPNRSPMCRLIASEDLFALMDALEEPVPNEVHLYLGNIGSNSTMEVYDGILMSRTSSPNTPNNNMAAATKPIAFMIGDDQEHGFESTLHEIECSDGQLLAMLRSWDGDHFLCLLEVWRRYFPEVNRSNLSAAIKRLDIETKIPTSQQTNLLRSAGVISVRGAPGRLIKVSDVQRVMEDFGILLKIGENASNDGEGACFPMYRGLVPVSSNKIACLAKPSTPQSEMAELADCMTLLLDCVEPSSMESLLLADQVKYTKQLQEIEGSMQGQSTQENILHNHILCRRQLCTVLNDEISFLTVTNHSMMSEIVHSSYTLRQILNEIDNLIDTTQIVKKS